MLNIVRLIAHAEKCYRTPHCCAAGQAYKGVPDQARDKFTTGDDSSTKARFIKKIQ